MLIPFPDDFRDERRAAESFIKSLWSALSEGWRLLGSDDLVELYKWEGCKRVERHWATISGLRIAVEQAAQLGKRPADYRVLKAALAGQSSRLDPSFVWISMRALLGAEVARRIEMPFAIWDLNLGDEGGFIATLVLEVVAGDGAGECAQDAGNALQVVVGNGFRDSMTAAWQVACQLHSSSDGKNRPDGRWRIEGVGTAIKGGSASGAAALGWCHALAGTVPDPGIFVIAEASPEGKLFGVDAVGLEAKLRAITADGRWDTVAVASGQEVRHPAVTQVPTLRALIELRSKLTAEAIQWLRGLADSLDQTDWYFKGKRILASETAVDAFVYTKQRLERTERQGSERSPIDESLARLYEEPLEREEREKSRWRQVIQRPKLRLGVLGAPGGGKTFLTRNSALVIARESASRIERREVSPYDAPVPFWLTARSLAAVSGPDAAENVVNASLHAIKQLNREMPLPPCAWLLNAAASRGALIVVDALDELVATDLASFQQGSRHLDALPGKLIATCRTMHWGERAPWLGWSQILDVELAPFEAREQREFTRRFPSASNTGGLTQLLAANYPLRQACGSPLLLAFVCLLHAEGKNLAGSNRVALYIAIVRQLLSGRWRNVTPPWAGDDALDEEVVTFLEAAAWGIFNDTPEANRFTLTQWKRAGEPPVQDLLSILVRCGLLVPAGFDDIGNRCWSFLHRTLLEFLAARVLARQPEATWLGEAKKHFWYEPEWVEVLTFLAAHVKDATPLIVALEQEQEDIFHSIFFLKARLAAAARQIDPDKLDTIILEVQALFAEITSGRKIELWESYSSIVQLAGGGPLGERLLKALFVLLLDEDSEVRRGAARSLGQLGDPRTFEPLTGLLQDESASVRGGATWALGNLRDARAFESLTEMLRDKDKSVRMEAIFALGRLGDARSIEVLARVPQSEDFFIRNVAARLLGLSGDACADGALSILLQDENRYVRLSVAQALGQSGDARSFEALTGLLRDEDGTVRRMAAQELGRFGDVELLEGLLQDENETVQGLAILALGRLGHAGAVTWLAGQLQSENLTLRCTAADLLARQGDSRAIEVLAALLHDRDAAVQRLAAQTLGQLGDVRAFEGLAGLLQDEDAGTWRQIAAEALGQLGDARAFEVLVVLFRDESRFVRSSAAKALGQLGDARAVDALVGLLRDEDGLVRHSVIKALRKLVAANRIRIPHRS